MKETRGLGVTPKKDVSRKGCQSADLGAGMKLNCTWKEADNLKALRVLLSRR